MLVRHAKVERVEPEISKFGGKFLHTSLSKEAEEKYQALLDQSSQASTENAKTQSAAGQSATKPSV